MAGAAFAGTFRVTYTLNGLIQRITVQAAIFAGTRRTVQAIIPGALVTGAHKVH